MSRLKEELKQKAPFSSLEEEVVLSLQRTARLVLDPWALFLRERSNLRPSQYNVLRILRGSHPRGLRCGEIAERTITRDPDVTRLIDHLEKRGLVRRERYSKDRRVVMVGITEAGLSTLAELDDAVAEMPRALLGHLGRERLQRLAELLEAARDGMGTYP
jgi:DNA-binding MarR family transcriptional regulator